MKNFKKLSFLAVCSTAFLTSCGMRTLTVSQAKTWIDDHYTFCEEKDITTISMTFSVSTDEKDKSKPVAKAYANEVSTKVGRTADNKTSFNCEIKKDGIAQDLYAEIASRSEKVLKSSALDKDYLYGSGVKYCFTTCNNEMSISAEGKVEMKILGSGKKNITITDIYNSNGQRRYCKTIATWKDGNNISFSTKYNFVIEFEK